MYLKRLKELRLQHNISQVQISEILEIKQPVYSRYERGVNTIPIEHLIKLSNLYNVSTDYILEHEVEGG